ncbi:hypothetical protein RKD31_001238 [Streptomyces sp. SAI-163]
MTTTPLTSASAPSLTVRSAGLPAASQYVEVESSVAIGGDVVLGGGGGLGRLVAGEVGAGGRRTGVDVVAVHLDLGQLRGVPAGVARDVDADVAGLGG